MRASGKSLSSLPLPLPRRDVAHVRSSLVRARAQGLIGG